MTYDFRGKVALVTGAGGRRGIGRATALRLARDGADVALLDVAWPRDQRPSDEQADWKGLASVAAEVEALGRKAMTIEADISNERQVQAAVERTLARFGGIDIFVANAGARPGGDRVPVLDLPEEELRRVLSVNVVGTFLCCKAVGRRMVERGKGGSVVVVSSEAGRTGRPRMAAYSASKFALIGLTQAFALEMAPHQVRVNAVCPGTVDTARLDWTVRTRLGDSGLSAEEMRARMLETRGHEIPLGRVATAEDVASVIAFLCASESGHMMGQSLNVNGGTVMH
ncbi:MAG: SDR family NAD(P)-dependent oxidoreductase [Dehalococcoidia bacterium]|nr:SDR family NAD(P)-dependent oxidoreductase [Dehalococcoidia bacterium]